MAHSEAHPNREPLGEVLTLAETAPEPEPAKPGSKQAVLRHFGIFKTDGDLEEQLATLRAIRKGS